MNERVNLPPQLAALLGKIIGPMLQAVPLGTDGHGAEPELQAHELPSKNELLDKLSQFFDDKHTKGECGAQAAALGMTIASIVKSIQPGDPIDPQVESLYVEKQIVMAALQLCAAVNVYETEAAKLRA